MMGYFLPIGEDYDAVLQIINLWYRYDELPQIPPSDTIATFNRRYDGEY